MFGSRVWRVVLALASSAIAGVIGCTPAPVEVSGTIKLRGQPPKVKGLEIVFALPDGQVTSAPIEPDGSYKADKVPIGEAKVGFAYLPPELAANKGKPRMVKPNPNGDAPKPGRISKSPVPKQYEDPGTSKITTVIEAGKPNVFNYDIK